MIRRRYVFTGRVQHVGFRWRARRAAEKFGCTGWCGNNPDGSVSMEIQGSRARIGLVVMAVRSSRAIRILHMEHTSLPVVPDERGFISRY